MKEIKKNMEIVAPAGDFERMRAAIKAGANSVYLGLKGFGARRKAVNFLLSELKEAIDYAHLRGVRVYLTLNTLMKETEINILYEKIKEIYEHGIDAFIVQDLGVLRFLRENFPEAELHASTQMTVTNHIEVEFLKSLGIKRVVPARELSFEEIKKIKEKTDVELEVFVSGALCISYSGNCYLSSFIGGRSGNRGLCAQPCRKSYIDENGNESFFLSPKDQLLQKEEVEKLIAIGVESIKIEGRMKSEEYVYETVKFYSEILVESNSLFLSKNNTEKLFNRGYSKGYFYENNSLMNPYYSSDLGYKIAEKKNLNEFLLIEDIILGDGIIYVDKNYKKISGTFVNNLKIKDYKGKDKPKKAFKGQTLFFNNIPREICYIYRTYDKKLVDSINFDLKQKKRKNYIKGKINIITGEKLKLTFYSNITNAEVEMDILEEAKKSNLSEKKIFEKISELGDTTFELEKLEIIYDKKAFVSFKMLKEIKRKTAEKFKENLVNSYRREAFKQIEEKFTEKTHSELEVVVCVMNSDQEKAAKKCGVKKIYYKQYDVAREAKLQEIDTTSLIAGNYYQLLKNENKKVTLDWNLNIGNSYAIKELSKIENLDTVYLSPELKKESIKEIKSDKLKKGLLIYGYLRVMYIEYPIFNKEKKLKNQNEDRFILRKNKLNNIEIYNREPLNLIPKFDELKELNLDEIRLDFVFETSEEVEKILNSLGKTKVGYNPYNFEKGIY